jgi:hypothetical protein
MKYAVEMGSGSMIYMPNFMKVDSGIQKLTAVDSQTHGQHDDRISLLSLLSE